MMQDYTIATTAEANMDGSPYDTGVRLEPFVWPPDGDPDRYGRVDFGNDEGTTIATLHIEGDPFKPEDAFVLHLDVTAPVVILGSGGEYVATVYSV